MAAAADNTATFAVDLNAQGAKAGAESAATALEALGNKIDEDTEALADMQKALRAMRGETSVNVKAFNDMKNAISAQKATLAQNTAALIAAGGASATVRSRMKREAAAALKEQKAEAKLRAKEEEIAAKKQEAAAAKAAAASKAAGLQQMAVLGGVVTALAAVAAAAVSAAASLFKYGIAAADAYRSERLQLEGLTKVRNWYGIAAGSAGDLQSAIDDVSASSALGRDQIVGYGNSLYAAGFRGAAFKEALAGVTTATSAAGEAQGELAKSMFLGFGRGSAAAKKLGDDIKARFGNVAKAQMLSLDVQAKKLKESFDALFRGLKLDGFLTALKGMTDLFSQNTASGRALAQILEVVMQPLLDGFEVCAPLAKRFYQGIILGAQQLVIEYYNVRLALKGAFGNADILGNVKTLTFALNLGKYAVYGLAVGVALLGAAFVAANSAILAIAAIGALVGFVIAAVADKIFGAAQSIASIDWLGLGSSLVDGLVGGIMAGVGKVVGAVKNLANAAKNALKSALDSHSPSRVGIAIGRTLPQGGAIGIEADTPLVARAARKMASAAEDNSAPSTLPRSSALSGGPAAAELSSAATGGSAGTTVSIGELHVHTQATDSKAIARDFSADLVAALKGASITMGAAA